VSASENFELSVSLVFGSLIQNDILKELEVRLRKTLISEVGILCQDICGKIVVLILAVEEDQVGEGLCWKRRILQQEVHLFESS